MFFAWSPFCCGNETGNGASLTRGKTALDHRAESSGDFLEIDSVALEQNYRTNMMALAHLGQAVAPDMISIGEGSVMITGKTFVYRGTPGFAGFALTKAPQRVLAESMARDLGPKSVLNLGYVAIDAVIDLEWSRKRMPETDDDLFANRMISLMSVIEFLISQYLLGHLIRLSGHLVRNGLLAKRACKKKPA